MGTDARAGTRRSPRTAGHRAVKQHLRNRQADKLSIGDPRRPARATARLQEVISQDVKSDEERVEAGGHWASKVNGARTPPAFDTSTHPPRTRARAADQQHEYYDRDLQDPAATYVTGFRAWLAMGYAVRRGERSHIRVWAPCPPSKRKLQAWRDAGANPSERPRTYFRLEAVSAQTQVEPLPSPAQPVPLDPPFAEVQGDTLGWARGPLEELASELSYRVVYRPLAPDHGGSCDPQTKLLTISTHQSINAQVDVACHELAHALVSPSSAAQRWRAQAIRELRHIGRRVHRSAERAIPSGDGIDALSGRERDVARLVCEHRTNREIASELFLSEKTVESHMRNIFVKLGARSRAEVARTLQPIT